MDPAVPTSSTFHSQIEKNHKKKSSPEAYGGSPILSHPVVSHASSHSESERDQAQLLNRHSDQHVITAPIIGDMIPLELFSREATTPSPDLQVPVTPIPHSDTPVETNEEGFDVREFFPMGCRAETLYERGWLDIACGPSISIDIEYCGHQHHSSPGPHTTLLPNCVKVDIDAPQVLLRAFGCLARDLLCLKENYPGEYIKMSPFTSNVPSAPPCADETVSPPLSKAPAAAQYDGPHEPAERTIDITVSFKLRNVTAEFPVDVSKDCPRNFPLPSLCTDVLRVQVDYVAAETNVCLHVDPLSVHVPSIETAHPTLAGTAPSRLGHVVINSIDLNCHGLTEFMCQERVEYAWMIQLLIGRITGAVSPLQLLHAMDWFLTAFVHIFAVGDGLAVAPDGELISPCVEPISEEIKYRLFQLDISEADIHVCDADSITHLQSSGFDLEMCTLHKSEETLGLSWQLHSLTGTGLLPDPQNPSVQLEVGLINVSNVTGGLALQEPLDCVPSRQIQFLHRADQRSQRLWFIWEGGPDMCGCCGGCLFQAGSISRRPLCKASDSAVYGPQFTPLTAIPRHLGMQDLPTALRDTSIDQVSCLWTLHRSLLDHYYLRYAGHRTTTHAHPSSDSDIHSSGSEIFQSARSSLTSPMDDKYLSLDSVNPPLEVDIKKTRHKKKPSNLSSDIRASVMEDVDGPQSMQEDYINIVPSHLLHSATFHISPSTGTRLLQSVATTNLTPTPPSFPQPPTSPQSVHSQDFCMYLPCVRQHCQGSVPMLNLKSSHSHTLERRRRAHMTSNDSPTDRGKQSPKFSVSLSICGANTLRFSPPLLNIVGR